MFLYHVGRDFIFLTLECLALSTSCRILLLHFVKISYYIMRRYYISQRFFITFRAPCAITFRENFVLHNA